jgi:phosphoserine aminotransferase
VSDRAFNFSAGPAVLPESVLKRAQEALWTLGDSGVGVLECSHRSPAFDEVIGTAEANIRSLSGAGDDYHVLFLQGGASSQFFMAPMNVLGKDETADYVNTGAWSKKAIAETKRFGNVHVAGSSEDETFTYIPKQLNWSDKPAYVHFTSNNTIYGTQWSEEPDAPAGVDLFCDASSDIFSRPVDISRYGILYAGAQKNLGPAGVTLVIIKKSLVDNGSKDLPTMLQYRTHADKGSRFNTPPAFSIFVVGEVVKWLVEFGGLKAVQEYNAEKAGLLYDYLDESNFFRGTARPDSRSQMNVTFRATTEELEKEFLTEAAKRGFSGLKGHRSVGGMRASIYNAFPREGVVKLLDFMKEFERQNS